MLKWSDGTIKSLTINILKQLVHEVLPIDSSNLDLSDIDGEDISEREIGIVKTLANTRQLVSILFKCTLVQILCGL